MATLRKEDSQLADGDDKPLIGPRQAALTAASTAHTLNSTFSDTEVETALNTLGTRINEIITALEAHGLVESND
jgi:hypothetical protein